MSPSRDWSDDTGSLRRFGLALARDERFVLDDATAARLVDKWIRQTSVAPIQEGCDPHMSGRTRCFSRLIQLYRRHIRHMAMEDNEGNWTEGPPARGGPAVVGGVRALPVEHREALLLVVLGGFSHEDAAKVLDIPLARLIERLERARTRLAEHMGAALETPRETGWMGAPHLRVIK